MTLTLLGVIGGLTGVVSSFIIACTLVEMTVNSFFSLYFGLLFLLISGLLYCRLQSSHQPQPQRHLVLLMVVALVFLAAVTALLLHPLLGILPYLLKIPVYALLGLALTFAFYFSLLDIVNYAVSLYHKYAPALPTSASSSSSSSSAPSVPLPPPLINTQQQVYLLTIISSLMGLAFGLTFSLLDVEDAPPESLRAALAAEQSVTYPIGFLCGAVGAVLNHISPAYEAYENLDGAAGEEGEFGL